MLYTLNYHHTESHNLIAIQLCEKSVWGIAGYFQFYCSPVGWVYGSGRTSSGLICNILCCVRITMFLQLTEHDNNRHTLLCDHQLCNGGSFMSDLWISSYIGYCVASYATFSAVSGWPVLSNSLNTIITDTHYNSVMLEVSCLIRQMTTEAKKQETLSINWKCTQCSQRYKSVHTSVYVLPWVSFSLRERQRWDQTQVLL